MCLKPVLFPSDNCKSFLLCGSVIFVVINALWYMSTAAAKTFGTKPIIYAEKRKAEKTGREFGMDAVRIIAILFVPLIHFFGNTNFYNASIVGREMFFMTALRWLVLNAVPLFMIITGYFKSHKDIEPSHYKAIIPVLMTHIVCSSVRLLTDYYIHDIPMTKEYLLDKLVYFNYGWYVKLYIGLLLLIPFLNKAYHGLETRAKKECLILTIILLTAMGPILYDVIPATWLIIYVLGYYFIGAYIKEYKIRINPVLNILLIGLIIFSASFGSYFRADGGSFDWNYLGYAQNSAYSSLPAFMASTLIVVLVSDMECSSRLTASAAKLFSIMSLEMYLFSQMFDMIIYKPYQTAGYTFTQYLSFAPHLLFGIIFFSFLASSVKKLIFFLIGKALNKTLKTALKKPLSSRPSINRQ